MENSKVSPGKTLAGVLSLIVLVALLFSARSMFEHVDAKEICVIQSPISGDFKVITQPGLYWQGFGTVTMYDKESQYWFSSKKDQGDAADESIKCRFNDGGHGNISGSVRVKMPLSRDFIIKIHTRFGSQEAVNKELIRTLIEKSLYCTGPLMSSKESSAEKRNDLLAFIEDQIETGVYKTRSKEVKEADAITGEMKTVTKVEIVQDSLKQFVRTSKSPLSQFGITVYNLSLNEIKYDPAVEKQIADQQKIFMDVQTSIADAKKAEQNAIKVEKEGEAKAMKAKWDQEVIKAQAVTEAEQNRAVNELNAKAAEFYKKEQQLRGEADGAYKRAVMVADGGLTQKLAAYTTIMTKYAEMIPAYKGNWVPGIIMGGGAGPSGGYNGAETIFQALGMKTLKDLSLDMTMPAGAKSGK